MAGITTGHQLSKGLTISSTALLQCDLLGDGEIKEFPGTDYAYRVFLPKTVWSQVVAELSNELDYDNFKSEVARHQGSDGAAYEHALHDVWSVMYRLQQ